MPRKTSAYHKSKTATSDNPFQMEVQDDNVLSSGNFHCYTNDLYYGNESGQEGIIRANAAVWFDGHIVVSDWWFKNVTPGSNGKIVIIGVLK